MSNRLQDFTDEQVERIEEVISLTEEYLNKLVTPGSHVSRDTAAMIADVVAEYLSTNHEVYFPVCITDPETGSEEIYDIFR